MDRNAAVRKAEKGQIDVVVPIPRPHAPIVPAAPALNERQDRNGRIFAGLFDDVGARPRQCEPRQVAFEGGADRLGLRLGHRRRRQCDPDERSRQIEFDRARQMLRRKHIPRRGRGQHHRRGIVEGDPDRLPAVAADLPGEPPRAARPQRQWRRGYILPTAAAGREHPAHCQIGDLGVFRKLELRVPGAAVQQPDDVPVGRGHVVGGRALQLLGRQSAIGAPPARFQDAHDPQIDDKGRAWRYRPVEAVGDCLRRGRRLHRLPQLVQPAPDRAVEQILVGPLDRRRVAQRLEQHGRCVLAIPPDRTAASTGDHHRIGIIDLDKDVIGARPRSSDRGNQALSAFIGAQVANRTFAIV